MREERKKIPQHIGFILDGNRRFAQKSNIHPHEGHEKGFDNLKPILKECKEKYDIKEVTIYAMSTQNFNRSEQEKNHLMRIFRRALHELEHDKEFGAQKETRICFIGKKEMFPKDIQEKMIALEEKTRDNSERKLNMCMAYGGREEIVHVCQQIARKVKDGDLDVVDIDEEKIRTHLWLDSYPDLVIRTSGEHRMSNFLPWQTVYSEWMFPSCFWPEFDIAMLDACIREYGRRSRRFGK